MSMSKEEFYNIFNALCINFNRKLDKEEWIFFYSRLKDMSNLREVVQEILQEDYSFPPLARILEVSRMLEARESEKKMIEEFMKRRENDL